MKVLFVSQPYPPYPIVGALRARKVAEMFRDRGHQVTVVTERLDGEEGDLRVNEERLSVRTVSAGLPYRLRLVALRNRLLGRSVALSSWDGPNNGSSLAGNGATSRRGALGMGMLKRFVIGLLRLPDDQQHFVAPAFRVSRKLAQDDTTVVYTTAPAFSTHLVGLMLRRRFDIRWIAEFRDPWTTDQLRREIETTAPALWRVHQWMERQCLRHADIVVAVTESVGRSIASKLPPEERGKIVVAMNGIDELQPPRQPRGQTACYRIVHTGSFYYDRDPRPFLEVLAGWMRDSHLTAADVQVEFVGRCRHYADVSVEEIVRTLGLDEVVRFHDWMAHDAVQQMVREADLVLLFAQSQPTQVPNKLFDYLGARAPILAVVDEGGESARILNAVGGQFVLETPVGGAVPTDQIRRALEDAYSRRDETLVTNEEVLCQLLAERQFAHLAEAIGA
jgi:glycosyltransferase involved in cell wall biosynthesis